MRVKILALRILTELKHDRRTLALVLVAPIMMLILIYFILNASLSESSIGVYNVPADRIDRLIQENARVLRFYQEGDAFDALEKGEITALLQVEEGRSLIHLDGSNSQKAERALQVLEISQQPSPSLRPDILPEVTYVYGGADMDSFDNFGSVLIGVLVFFFVFIVAGMSFLQERTTGTLEKLLSTPIRRWELVLGYVTGFGTLTVIQSLLITYFVLFVLDVMLAGSVVLVLVTTLLTAICALTLGMLLSAAASSQFQMLQFIPLVITPQIFFCGLFQLSPGWEIVGRFMPMYYSADALNRVMIKGEGLLAVLPDLLILSGFSAFFILANIRLLKRFRSI